MEYIAYGFDENMPKYFVSKLNLAFKNVSTVGCLQSGPWPQKNGNI